MSKKPHSGIEPRAHSSFDTLIPSAKAVGIACSGGGDSIALLHLMQAWAEEGGVALYCATVDHGLRAEAAKEAAFVARTCSGLGIPHSVLEWSGWDGNGNLQDKARQARYRLLSEWGLALDLDAVALGHTEDDVVETVVMRLARGSGVDGLSPMAARFPSEGIEWVRPLLGIRRDELREYLSAQGRDWVEDPSNDDPRFDRVRIRKALPLLADIGIDRQALLKTGQNMRSARDALEHATLNVAKAAVTVTKFGSVQIDRPVFDAATLEVRRRILTHCLKFVSGAHYKLGLMADDPVWTALKDGKNHSVGGCLIIQNRQTGLEVVREPNAMPISADFALPYDGRWEIECKNAHSDHEIRPLGEQGLRLRPVWRDAGASRQCLAATPSIWHKGELLYAPLLDITAACSCRLIQSDHEFLTSIVTH